MQLIYDYLTTLFFIEAHRLAKVIKSINCKWEKPTCKVISELNEQDLKYDDHYDNSIIIP